MFDLCHTLPPWPACHPEVHNYACAGTITCPCPFDITPACWPELHPRWFYSLHNWWTSGCVHTRFPLLLLAVLLHMASTASAVLLKMASTASAGLLYMASAASLRVMYLTMQHALRISYSSSQPVLPQVEITLWINPFPSLSRLILVFLCWPPTSCLQQTSSLCQNLFPASVLAFHSLCSHICCAPALAFRSDK